MKLTAEMLRRIAMASPNANIIALIVDGINTHGARFGLDQPHRMAHYLANVALESGGLHFSLPLQFKVRMLCQTWQV